MPTVPAIYLPMSYKWPRWIQGQIVALSIVAHGATRGHLLFRHSGGVLLPVGQVYDTNGRSGSAVWGCRARVATARVGLNTVTCGRSRLQ